MRPTLFGLMLIVFAMGVAPVPVLAGDFYVSPDGDDAADGTSPTSAWRTLTRAGSASFAAGDRLLLQRDAVWRESLIIDKQVGTESAPITVGAYGVGAAPVVRGSDLVSGFESAADLGTNVFVRDLSGSAPVSSVLKNNHTFLRSSFLRLGKNASVQQNLQYLAQNEGHWFFDETSEKLYVSDAAVLISPVEAVTRNVGVAVRSSEHVHVKDLTIDNTAHWNHGYSLAVDESPHTRITDVLAINAGKHHFTAANSDEFLGQDLKAIGVMPDLGFGGASALVSYSHLPSADGHDYLWKDIEVDFRGSDHQNSFYHHGLTVGDVMVEGLTTYNSGFSSSNEGQLVLRDSIFRDGEGIGIRSNGAIVEDVQILGGKTGIGIYANDVTISNLLLDQVEISTGYKAPLVIAGDNNQLQFVTFNGDAGTAGSSSVALLDGSIDNQLWAVVTNQGEALMREFGANVDLDVRYALASMDSFTRTSQGSLIDWNDPDFDFSTFQFDSLPQYDQIGETLQLTPSSLAIGLVDPSDLSEVPTTDVYGQDRALGGALTAGAITTGAITAVPEPAVGMVVVVASLLALQRRSRKKTD